MPRLCSLFFIYLPFLFWFRLRIETRLPFDEGTGNLRRSGDSYDFEFSSTGSTNAGIEGQFDGHYVWDAEAKDRDGNGW